LGDAGVTEQVESVQHTLLLDHPPGSDDESVHWLPAGPPHLTVPEQELGPHVTLEVLASQSTPPEQLDPAHVTVHDCVALQVTCPEQLFMPQWTVQLDPAHTTPPEHELEPHSMSQLAAFEQSTMPLHPLAPHCTTQATPAGHATPDEHVPVQSMTQLPLASHVPPGHDCAVHGAPAGPPPPVDEEPHAASARKNKSTATSLPTRRPSPASTMSNLPPSCTPNARGHKRAS
jgi:hypothetical protein